MFRALALRQSKVWAKSESFRGLCQSESSDEGVSFSISVRWSIYIINAIDKANFRVSLPHRRSTTVSSETNPLYSFEV